MDHIDTSAIETKTSARHDSVIDGRTARRNRNKAAVLDALIELAAEGDDEPAIEVIAERAGVSYRSVYRYFEDRTELMLAALGRLMDDVWPWLDPERPGDGTFDERIAAIVSDRVRIYRKLAPLGRIAVRRRVHEPDVAGHYERIRDLLCRRLASEFEPELAALPAPERSLSLASLAVAFQFEALDYLAQRDAMTDEQLEEVLAHQIRAHLGATAVG